ncbi:hypothetical protein M5K25_000446 [Dendrobium thyrsiflorum]|uniref:Aminotransferase-like plant mobile domain-containing protein n=1 Tax=Dendrobium thyrsiflorum TaxID=117978 RepID=A0ABD0VVG8_DENTH
MVGEWMMDPIKIPWFRHPGSSWSLVYLVRGGSRPNLTEGFLSAAMGCFVQGYLVDLGQGLLEVQDINQVKIFFYKIRTTWLAVGVEQKEGVRSTSKKKNITYRKTQDLKCSEASQLAPGSIEIGIPGRRAVRLRRCFVGRDLTTCLRASLVRPPFGRRLTDRILRAVLVYRTDWSCIGICCRDETLFTAFLLALPYFRSVLRALLCLRTPTVPAADVLEPVGQSGLLSHRQLQSAPLEWPRDSVVGRVQSPVSGYVCWARYVLQAHRGTLQEAGIYEAVYTSLFDYGRLPTSWARGLVEFWDASRGTCWVGAEELTLTLSDLQMVSGLPVFGHPFEECVPPDEQLFSRVPSADGDRRGRLTLSDVYPALLEHYHLYDLFGLDLQRGVLLSEETAEPSPVVGCPSPVLPGVTEDLCLAGFLATWLCTFVLHLRAGFVHYSVLLAASQMSQGQCLSLAPAVLARVYRSLHTASEATSLELRDLTLPWHYLYGWIHLHILGAFSCLECPPYFAERGYPTVLQFSQASATLESKRVRLFFFAPHLVADRFSLVHQPKIASLPSHLRGTVVVDGVDHRGRRTLL